VQTPPLNPYPTSTLLQSCCTLVALCAHAHSCCTVCTRPLLLHCVHTPTRACPAVQVRAREGVEAARLAERKQVADRIYERLKADQEAAQRAADEEQELINLMRQVGGLRPELGGLRRVVCGWGQVVCGWWLVRPVAVLCNPCV
jgi:hypothetical protein